MKVKRIVFFCYFVIKEYSCLLITRVVLSFGVFFFKVGGFCLCCGLLGGLEEGVDVMVLRKDLDGLYVLGES